MMDECNIILIEAETAIKADLDYYKEGDDYNECKGSYICYRKSRKVGNS